MNNYKQNSGCLGKNTGIFLGLLLTLAGTLFLAFNLGWLNPELREVLISWRMIFVLFAIIALWSRWYLLSLFWTALAAFFLLPQIARVYPEALPWVDGDFAANYWPLLVIILGIIIIVRIFFGKNSLLFLFRVKGKNFASYDTNAVRGTDGVYSRSVVFGGAEDVFLEPVFRAGALEVVFGGVELNLCNTSLPEGDTYLNINVVFGGAEIRIPDHWEVVVEVGSTFGGVEDSRKNKSQAEIDRSRRLIIKGDVVFGGVEIR
jgi:hypothetical protein